MVFVFAFEEKRFAHVEDDVLDVGDSPPFSVCSAHDGLDSSAFKSSSVTCGAFIANDFSLEASSHAQSDIRRAGDLKRRTSSAAIRLSYRTSR